MTVESVIQPDIYDGDGVTRDWAITFDVDELTETDFELYLTEAEVDTPITTGYEIDLVTPQVTYPTVVSGLDLLTSSQKITIKPVLPLKQEFIDVAVQGSIPLPAIESGFDRVVLMLQQQQEEIGRAVKVGVTATNPDELIDNINDAVAASAASEAASAVSEANAATSASNASTSADEAAANAAGVSSVSGTYQDADIVGGVLTITHNFGLSAPYTLAITFVDNLGVIFDPDKVEFTTNTILVTLATLGTISGVYGYIFGTQAVIELASQAEAESGTDNAHAMTSLRVKQYVDSVGAGGYSFSLDGGVGTNCTLSGSLITVPHNITLSAPDLSIVDTTNGEEVKPDNVLVSGTESITVDMTSFSISSGLWAGRVK